MRVISKRPICWLVTVITASVTLGGVVAQTTLRYTTRSKSSTMKGLRSRHLFTITMKLAPTLELGETPAGIRRVFTVSSGQFMGDRLRGMVRPQGGSDLLLVREDGSAQQDVRL